MKEKKSLISLKGFSLLEVSLALSIGIVVILLAIGGYGGYMNDVNYHKAKMILETVRVNINQYKFRKGGANGPWPTYAQIAANADDSGRAFYPGGYYPADPITNIGDPLANNKPDIRNKNAAAGPCTVPPCINCPRWDACVPATNAEGGWCYDANTGVFTINLDPAKYGKTGTTIPYPEDADKW